MSDRKSKTGRLGTPAGEFRFVCYTDHFEMTVAFYRDGLGLDVVGGWDRGTHDRGVLFRAASGIIEVLHTHSHDASSVGAWLLIEVMDVGDLYWRVRKAGLPLREELRDTPWGHRRFVVTDPNGVNVAFFSYVGERDVRDHRARESV